MNQWLRTLLLISFFVACQQKEKNIIRNSEWSKRQAYVVMVSIDGFRHDFAEKFGAANILLMKENGTSTSAMIPSYPSKTFPNHYTIVTGMYPGNHGIVGNEFYSRSKENFYGKQNWPSVTDGKWYGGKPLWVLAEENSMVSASYFWVGSEAAIQGTLPSYYFPYVEDTPNSDRVDQVLDWLHLDEPLRPHFITLYFSDVDTQGHKFGPDAEETKKAVIDIDEQIGRLRRGLISIGLPVTLIVTGDHGLTEIGRGIRLDVDWRGARTIFSTTQGMVYSSDRKIIEAIKVDLQQIDGIKFYEKDEIPEQYHFENEDRVGDLLITVNPPMIFSESGSVKGGTHGYDPYMFEDMHTIFYMEGPTIKSNHVLPAFENVHVFPFIASLLGLTSPKGIDGKIEVLQEAKIIIQR